MKPYYVFFASTRYWPDESALQNAYRTLQKSLGADAQTCALILDPKQLEQLPADCVAVAIPMSGAVQRNILATAEKAAVTVLYGAYIDGNADKQASTAMLRANAAPTLMDCWGVLRRGAHPTMLALDRDELERCLRVAQAYRSVKHAKLLLIGETEPWVISNADDLEAYARLGITVEKVAQQEVRERYEQATQADASPFYHYFRMDGNRPRTLCEPNEEDMWAAARMAWALVETLRVHQADGMALACFNLLSTKTNCCLGVSWLNDCSPYVAACEGDVDSAVTMLAMKHLTKTKLWMANPGLHPGGVINFSHCTAPLALTGSLPQPCTLRNHHESGIGVSLQVDMPHGTCVTACRISDNARSLTVHVGKSENGKYEQACRTQMYVRFADFAHYRQTVLGCHQVFAFENIESEIRQLAGLLNLEIL